MPESFTDTPLLTPRFDAALHYAAEHHRRQLRKGTPVPYTAHLLAVASLVLEMHGDEDEAIGALLHDVVEDGGGTPALEHIEREFGPHVAQIVLDNSDKVDDPAAARSAPPAGRHAWYERKRAYVDAIPGKSPAALRVSLADKLHNARSILIDYRTHGDAVWARFKQGQGLATRVYYRELAAAFERERERLGVHAAPAVDELRRTVDAITALAVEHQGPDSHELFDGGADRSPQASRVRKARGAGRTSLMDDDNEGTPARDHQDAEAFGPAKEAVSDQQGETAPAHADHQRDDEDGDDTGDR